MSGRFIRAALLAATVASVALVLGCESDVIVDKPLPGPGTVDPASASIQFQPAGQPGPGMVWLELGTVDVAEGTFTLLVKGDGLSTAYGVAGRLRFDTSVCTLQYARPGNALEAGTAEVIAAGAGNDEGGVFGMTRSKDFMRSAEITASEVIGTLHFEVAEPGTTEIRFADRRSAVLSHELQRVDVTAWLGGTLTVE